MSFRRECGIFGVMVSHGLKVILITLCVVLIGTGPDTILAASTAGPFSAGTAQSGTTGTCTDNMNWSVTTTDLSANDTSYVSYTGNNWDAGDVTDIVEASNFGFSVSGTVLGITVDVLGFTTQGSGTYHTVQLMTVPGATPTLVGSNKATGSLPTSDPGSTYQSFGNSADTWSAGLAATDVNSSGFGVGLCWTAGAANSRANIDNIRITVTYDAAPTLAVSQPDGVSDAVTAGDSYNITYNLADSDNIVTAAFYYDTDSTGLDGTAISGACATAAEGSGATCSWDTTGVTPGSYYVYGITSDGVNPSVNAYSSGQITISAPAGSAPSVATNPALVGATTATLHGAITNTGGNDATEHGFAYSTDSGLSTGVSTTTLGSFTGTGNFEEGILGLNTDTPYYYRAYATNGSGTGYGTIRTFTTGNNTITRTMRLFEGFVFKLVSGTMKLFGH